MAAAQETQAVLVRRGKVGRAAGVGECKGNSLHDGRVDREQQGAQDYPERLVVLGILENPGQKEQIGFLN